MTVRVLLALSLLIAAGCSDTTSRVSASSADEEKLVIEDHQPGFGEGARQGARVAIHYTGWLYDPTAPEFKGAMFDSSHNRGRPLSFILGTGQVIEGWDEGVAGMKEGGTRTLIIPPEMAYGSTGAGATIPPNATLVFDLELVDIID